MSPRLGTRTEDLHALAHRLSADGVNLSVRAPGLETIRVGVHPDAALVSFHSHEALDALLEGDHLTLAESFLSGAIDVEGDWLEVMKVTEHVPSLRRRSIARVSPCDALLQGVFATTVGRSPPTTIDPRSSFCPGSDAGDVIPTAFTPPLMSRSMWRWSARCSAPSTRWGSSLECGSSTWAVAGAVSRSMRGCAESRCTASRSRKRNITSLRV